ncbi:RNA-dependent ATPase [Thecaphora frezii]
MSATLERKAEDRTKSQHKKEKKAKRDSLLATQDAADTSSSVPGTPTPMPAADDSSEKLSKKDKKKAQKRAAEEDVAAQADASSASKKAKVDSDDAAKEDKKKKKKKEKKEKKAKKEAAADAPSASTEEAAVASSSSSSAPAASSFTPTDPAAARAFMESNNITLEAPEESDERPPLPMIHFHELAGKVDEAVRKTLDAQGFKNPTPIQACCWPVLLQNKDVVGVAETGSGKTFAFGLPALQHLVTKHNVLAAGKKAKKGGANVNVLVIAPTRELAIQTEENLAKLGKSMGVGSICLYGGVSKSAQIDSLKQSPPIRIVVGTPGRVLDLARDGDVDLSNVTYLVLDEADRMLDKGFEPDIRAIIGMCKSREEGRHTSMFSATWPPAVRGLAETFMNAPIRVTVGSDELSANKRVEQVVEVLDDGRAKERRLDQFLRSIGAGGRGAKAQDKVLIFALYKKEAQRVENTLRRSGYRVSGIHGDLGQHERIANLDKFKTGETPLLVATDVAARGLDIPNVEYVVNLTFPLTIEDYVHRIGRTGRGGKTGKSLTFFTDEDKAHAGELVRVLKDAGQAVPEALMRFPTTIKKKTHSSYGDHFKELVPGKAKKITFDD